MKVLIADDEPHIRNGLRKRIKWEELGIEEVVTAEDGKEALQVCKELRPQIIITDIRMPGIDGLELAEQAAGLYGAKKILIMSGYSEFEYAKTAIRIGVVDYLLKPVNLDELTQSIRQSVREIKEEKENEKLAYLKKAHSLLSGQVDWEDCQDSWPAEAELSGELICGVIRVDNLYGMLEEKITEEMFENAACDLCEEPPVIFYIEESYLVFIIKVPNSKARSTYHGICSSILYRLNKNNALSCSMGVSGMGQLSQIKSLYLQAENALCHRMYMGGASCIFSEMVSVRQQPDVSFYLDVSAFKEQASRFCIEEANGQIQDGFRKLSDEHCTDKKRAQEHCILIKNALVEAMREKGVDILGLLENNKDMVQKPIEFDTLKCYEQWSMDICYLLMKGLKDLSQERHSNAVAKAVDYINQHYQEDITLGYLAESAGKSTNYFSFIFKKEMGMNFNEYLNDVRIRRAKEILKTTDAMIYEVSERVGYHDYKYFTKVFKKVCGCSPSEFKERG